MFLYLLFLATFAGSVNLKLWKTDKTFSLFILKGTLKRNQNENKTNYIPSG